jgi:hypothetical protein
MSLLATVMSLAVSASAPDIPRTCPAIESIQRVGGFVYKTPDDLWLGIPRAPEGGDVRSFQHVQIIDDTLVGGCVYQLEQGSVSLRYRPSETALVAVDNSLNAWTGVYSDFFDTMIYTCTEADPTACRFVDLTP